MSLGKQIVADFYDCDPGLLDDPAFLEEALTRAVRDSGATVVRSVFHQFAPHGVTGVVVIMESHVSIHTWPEHGFAALDIFTCSAGMDGVVVLERLRDALRAQHFTVVELKRGVMPPVTRSAL